MAGKTETPVLREKDVLIQRIKEKVDSGEISIEQLRAFAATQSPPRLRPPHRPSRGA